MPEHALTHFQQVNNPRCSGALQRPFRVTCRFYSHRFRVVLTPVFVDEREPAEKEADRFSLG
jgi:hypothetical protein